MAGKGDTYRKVDMKIYGENYDRIFKTPHIHVGGPREDAIAYLKDKLAGIKRADGSLAIDHAIRVANHFDSLVKNETGYIAALLHDVPEDFASSAIELQEVMNEITNAFGSEIADTVFELTNWHTEETPRINKVSSLITKCSSLTNIAKIIKLCDRWDNLCSMNEVWEDKRKRQYAIEALALVHVINDNTSAGIYLSGMITNLCLETLSHHS